MSAYRWQSRDGGETLPIVVNNNNFAKGPPGEPTLLSADDVRTLFHEFGHGLHGLLSQVTYERLSGTHVLQDFVELPSQIVRALGVRARGAASATRCITRPASRIPDELIERLQGGAALQPGLRDRRIHGLRARRHGAARATPIPRGVDITRVRARGARAHRDAARDRAAPPAAAFRPPVRERRIRRPATTSTCGPRCSTPTATMRSSRPAIRSIRRSPSACSALRLFVGRNACRRPRRIRSFRGRDPRVEPLLAQRGLAETGSRLMRRGSRGARVRARSGPTCRLAAGRCARPPAAD